MRCEKMHATIPVATCLARQKEAARTHSTKLLPLECRNCDQGKLAKQGKLKDEDIAMLHQSLGAGNSTAEGQPVKYETLWEAFTAVLKGWPAGKKFTVAELGEATRALLDVPVLTSSFTVYLSHVVRAGLPVRIAGRVDGGSARIYERTEGEWPDLKQSQVQKKAAEYSARKRKAETPEASRKNHVSPDGDKNVSLDFSGQPEIHTWLVELAREEFRTVEGQILYFLSKKQKELK